MSHFDLSDTEFEQQIVHCSFPADEFTHEAHLRLAYMHIQKYGIKLAQNNIQNLLLNFVQYVGAKDKYNKTLTIAAIKVVYHFMQNSTSENFVSFLQEFPQLKSRFKQLIDVHYSFDIFNSKKAKQAYLEPDLLPFDVASY